MPAGGTFQWKRPVEGTVAREQVGLPGRGTEHLFVARGRPSVHGTTQVYLQNARSGDTLTPDEILATDVFRALPPSPKVQLDGKTFRDSEKPVVPLMYFITTFVSLHACRSSSS